MQTQCVIVGAGPVGLSMACSLAQAGLEVTVLEKQTQASLADPQPDGREVALTHGSKAILEDLAVWQHFQPNEIAPIKKANVFNGNSTLHGLHFDAHSVSCDALGYLVANHVIRRALYARASVMPAIRLLTETVVTHVERQAQQVQLNLSNGECLQTPLLIACDGRFSQLRRDSGIAASAYDFGRSALVCRMAHDQSHQQTAHECFYYDQTMALLPLNDQQSSLVITLTNDKVEQYLALAEADFNRMIEKQLQHRLGAMRLVGERYTYPLVAVA